VKEVKYLYMGKELYGIGEGLTQRQAKINCAKIALENLEEGKVMEKPCSKNGLIAYLRENNNDLASIVIQTDINQIIS
jgi:hypothetical protein